MGTMVLIGELESFLLRAGQCQAIKALQLMRQEPSLHTNTRMPHVCVNYCHGPLTAPAFGILFCSSVPRHLGQRPKRPVAASTNAMAGTKHLHTMRAARALH